MKRFAVLVAILSFIILLFQYNVAYGIGDTSFTYLGYLEESGMPVTDSCDFDFSLFAVESDGVPIADMPPINVVTVDRGVFYVTLDFGDIFTGDIRWLETAVRCPSGEGSFITLIPRVPLKYPIEGLLPGVYPDGTGKVGINKTNPAQMLDVNGVIAATGGTSTDWNTAYSWGNHAAQGYLTTETDPQVGSLVTNQLPKWTGSLLGDSLISDTGTFVGINDTTPSYRLDVNGSLRTTGNFLKTASGDTVVRITSGSSAGIIEAYGSNGARNDYIGWVSGDANAGYMAVMDSGRAVEAGMYVNGAGNGVIFADTKNFRMSNPDQPGTEIWYASLEGPEVAAYVRGTAQLVNGQATITLPDHFLAVASPAGVTVQLTPLSADSEGLAVVSKTLAGIEVQELHEGKGTYEFDFFVTAVRQGYENYEVIRSVSDKAQPEFTLDDQGGE